MASDPPDTDMQPSVGRYSVEPFLKQEVSDQIRNRDPKKRVSWNWYDTWQEEHLRAFVVAKLCKADLLQEVHSSLQKAVDTGMTFAEWKKKVTPKLKGEWLGRTYGDIWENDLGRDIEDLPENQREKKISPRRLETIYRTNMKVAHAAGQYQSLKDMADLYPYWRYCTVNDGRVRDEHMAMHNKVFRHDDPIWNTHYPPNGWNCRCYVRAMDDMDLEDEGLEVTDSRDLKKIKFEGEQSGKGRIAYGIGEHVMDTDDGWNYNPGKVSAQVVAMAKKKMGKYEPPLKSEVEKEFGERVATEERREAKLLELRPQQDAPAIQDDGGRLRKATEAQDEPVELKEHVSKLSFTKGLETILNWLGKSIEERPAVKFSRKEALHNKEGKVVCVKYWQPKYKSLKHAVNSIKDCKVEHAIVFDQHGKCVVEIVGGPKSVDIDLTNDMTGWTIIHNHPNGSAFSYKDVKYACWYKLARIMAVCGEKTYSFAPSKCPAEKYMDALTKVSADIIGRQKTAEWNNREFYADHSEEIWDRLLKLDVGCSRWQ